MKNTEMKIKRNPRRSLTKTAAKAGISQTSMKRLVRDGLKMIFFRLLKRHHLTEQNLANAKEAREKPGFAGKDAKWHTDGRGGLLR